MPEPCAYEGVDSLGSEQEETIERALSLMQAGKGAAAEAALQGVLAVVPESARAWFLTGAARHIQLRPEAALAAMEQALSRDPAMAEAKRARATLLLGLKRPRAALAEIEALLSRRPAETDFLVDAGVIDEALGEFDRALLRYRAALGFAPRHFRALLNRGALLMRLGRAEEALSDNRLLAKCHVGSAIAFQNLGENLLALHRVEEATAAFTRALSIAPSHVPARMGLGVGLSMRRRFAEADAEFARARRDDPVAAQSYLQTAGRAAGSPGSGTPETHPRLIFIHGAMFDQASCRWQRRAALLEEIQALVSEPSPPAMRDRSLGFNSLGLPFGHTERRNVARLVAATVSAPVSYPRLARRQDGRLRIGYLSPDFRPHPAARNHWRILQLHDRERFEVVGLSLHPGDDGPERKRIVSNCDRFVELSGLDEQAAIARVALEDIDILVDIAGYTDHARPEILAARVAPIRVQHMGAPMPCGGNFVDYRITDPVMTPPEEADQWDEKLVWLPETCWTCDDTATMAPAPGRRECGLPERGFVFCCFNQHFKVEPDVFEVWMRLLGKVEGSVLWLLEDKPDSCADLRQEAVTRGIPAERLIFAPRCEHPKHLARHACADLFLDTFHYNAHTTASEALYAGLPVLTLPGRSMAARFCASLVRAARLPDMVAADPADYETRALRLAADADALKAMRADLLSHRSSSMLFDMPRRTGEIEAAYQEMWRRHSLGLASESFSVAQLELPRP